MSANFGPQQTLLRADSRLFSCSISRFLCRHAVTRHKKGEHVSAPLPDPKNRGPWTRLRQGFGGAGPVGPWTNRALLSPAPSSTQEADRTRLILRTPALKPTMVAWLRRCFCYICPWPTMRIIHGSHCKGFLAALNIVIRVYFCAFLYI